MNQVNIEKFYAEIEYGFATVEQLMAIETEDCGEPLVEVNPSDNLLINFDQSRSLTDLMGRKVMYLRETVAKMLNKAAKNLRITQPDMKMQVFYGYRALEVQTELYAKYEQILSNENPQLKADELRERVHRIAAYPLVAGHPTGGAVDVTLFDEVKQKNVDMGIGINRVAWVKAGRKLYTFSPEITDEAAYNRRLLAEIMCDVGFESFDGEFWHFSYGDREWAYLSGADKAIYSQIPYNTVARIIQQ